MRTIASQLSKMEKALRDANMVDQAGVIQQGVSTLYAREHLDIPHPAQRIRDLRQKGWDIDTLRLPVVTPYGRKTWMALYVERKSGVNEKEADPKTDPSIEDTIGRQPVEVRKTEPTEPHFTGPGAADHYRRLASYSAYLRATENPVAAALLTLTAVLDDHLEVLVNNVSGISDNVFELANMADEVVEKHIRGVL